ncbi:MAG: hypothetical protein GY820_38250 [Gammaproteobacteria bacterium]|nr:hypothetical protein [Gammaproteobacteria bacterium]
MKNGKYYRVPFRGIVLETKSLKEHSHNVRCVAACGWARKYGFEEAAIKFKYSSVTAMKKIARKKLGDAYPFAKQKTIPDEVVQEAVVMRKTMTVQAIADHFGVSQSHLGKKIKHAKNNSIYGKIFQQILCTKF